MLANVKSVVVAITQEMDDDESFGALAYGLSLAEEARAHLTVQAASLHLSLPHPFVSDVAARVVASENYRLHRLANAAAEQTRQQVLMGGIVCEAEALSLTYPELLSEFTQRARSHDLTIVDAEPLAYTLDRDLVEALVLKSGRPLIVVPPAAERFCGERILVAWDGSAKAARAINDALPFLRAAHHVEVLSVTGEKQMPNAVAGAELAEHLVRHGARVTVRAVPAEKRDAAEVLRREAVLSQADMLVMGAFVHSQLRQSVFGGVTESLLTDTPIPLFLSH